MQVLVFMC